MISLAISIIIFFNISLMFIINFTSLKRYKKIINELLLLQLLILIIFSLYLNSSHFSNLDISITQYFSDLFHDSDILKKLKHLFN